MNADERIIEILKRWMTRAACPGSPRLHEIVKELLDEETRILRSALEYYANPHQYKAKSRSQPAKVLVDRGHIAREALNNRIPACPHGKGSIDGDCKHP